MSHQPHPAATCCCTGSVPPPSIDKACLGAHLSGDFRMEANRAVPGDADDIQ